MLIRIRCLIFALLAFYIADAQTDQVGSGGAMEFDGIDDYINYGDIYSDLELPFTISAWVNLAPGSGPASPIFSSRNCDPVYTGFRLIVNNNTISIDYGDGLGGNNPAFRKGKNATVGSIAGRWNHITAVVRSNSDMDLYLNGVNVGGTYMGGSSLTMDSSKPGFASTAYFISNGTIYRFKGTIDDIRLWNRALSEAEIRNTMCVNLTGNEPGLIGYWNFNEVSGNTIFDSTPGQFNGTFVGAPTWVRSGAPIGDVSTQVYSTIWNGATVTLTNGSQTLHAKNISSAVKGIHLYSVNSAPSQTTGLDGSNIQGPYFGVFVAQQLATNYFDVAIDGGGTCSIYSRESNSSLAWDESPSLSGFSQRTELFLSEANLTPLELGSNVSICDQNEYTIGTGISDPQILFSWNNGASTPSINVSASGKYVVTATGLGPCSIQKDSVQVEFNSTPQPFSFGDDVESCAFPVTLQVPECFGCVTTWQDGSTDKEFNVKGHGTFWAVNKNVCGEYADSISFSKPEQEIFIPNVITPNNDGRNDFFILPDPVASSTSVAVFNRWGERVFFSNSYNNEWSGRGLSTGCYFVLLNGPCVDSKKFVISILK